MGKSTGFQITWSDDQHLPTLRLYPFPIPDSRFPIPDSRFPIPDSRFPIPDSPFPTTKTSLLSLRLSTFSST
ncbi:hypothetical protein [Moorena sp. SIO3I6]|uniref:hypothetical protein n=1 Tax=Moorena sp. SIO3I6 TaxID=2607831 RepID=UPI0013FB140E|nr:hypothetical protein [Moorena sp. SIO3I6]NEP26293.1 hypothetical protein [Moorena sp. SIO3I6]